MPAMSIGGKTPTSSLATSAKKAVATGKVSTPKSKPKVLANPKPDSAKGLVINADNANPVGTPMVGSIGENISQGIVNGVPVPDMAASATPAWALESDPVYRAALKAGESAFNFSRNAAVADKQNTETAKAAERKALDVNATESRRRLAGNYASRGMAGGAMGALGQAESRANAEQIAAQTSIKDQLAAINSNFLANYGDVNNANYDWTGTLTGQQYKTQAAQQALQSALARYGTV